MREHALVVVASLVLMAVLTVHGAPLWTPASPQGIVSYELAFTEDAAAAMIAAWQAIPGGVETARGSLWIDFLFLVAYPRAIQLTCTRFNPTGAAWPVIVGRAQWLAGALDVVENLALLRQLDVGADATLAAVAAGCATLKFGIVGVGIYTALRQVLEVFVPGLAGED